MRFFDRWVGAGRKQRDPLVLDVRRVAAAKPRLYSVAPQWRDIALVGINQLPLPAVIPELMNEGRWLGRTVQSFPHRAFSSERKFHLYSLKSMAYENLYWEYNTEPEWVGVADGVDSPGSIDPSQSVLIGDFGLGTDQPIALDFRASVARPIVVGLKWRRPKAQNTWIEIASNIEDFATMVQL